MQKNKYVKYSNISMFIYENQLHLNMRKKTIKQTTKIPLQLDTSNWKANRKII